jgi:hypothetical protein
MGCWMESFLNGSIDGCIDRWVVDWMDGLENVQMDGWIYG